MKTKLRYPCVQRTMPDFLSARRARHEEMDLTLFVMGLGGRSYDARQAAKLICEEIHRECRLEVVDIAEHPEAAEEYKIIGTPTLVRLSPMPIRRVVGDLTATKEIAAYFERPRW
jgi:circadian clock protein KaiB